MGGVCCWVDVFGTGIFFRAERGIGSNGSFCWGVFWLIGNWMGVKVN